MSKTSNSYITEGIIKDALNSQDAQKIKDEWNKANVPGKVKTVADALDTNLGKAKEKLDTQKVDTTSIIARARKSTLLFPVYITQSIRVNEAQIIAQLFSRVYATYVQAVIAQNPILDEDEANNLVFIKKFHTNIKESMDLQIKAYKDIVFNEYYTPIDGMDQVLQDSILYREQVSPTCEVVFRWVPSNDPDLLHESKRLMNEPLAGFSYLREANYEQPKTTTSQEHTDTETNRNTKRTPLSEDDLREIAMDRIGLKTSDKELINKSDEQIRRDVEARRGTPDKNDQGAKDAANAEINDRITRKHNVQRRVDAAVRDLKKDIRDQKLKGYAYNGTQYYRIDANETKKTTTRKSTSTNQSDKKYAPDVIRAVDAPKLLHDADIKKINDMLPWTIEVTFRLRSKNGDLERDVHYLIGVKTALHLIRTEDLVDDLEELVTGNIKSLRKVKYKTGEINFMDYVFNVSQLKKDASKSIDYNKRWLYALKQLAEFSKTNGSYLKVPTKFLAGGDVPIPNGTLILSQTDVETLKSKTGIDLEKVSNAKRLCKSIFLISFVIVDSSAGTMRVCDPSLGSWDVQSLASVNAELAKTDNSALMRELNKAVNKG